MKRFAIAAMVLVVGLGACANDDKESPDHAQKKAQCHEVLAHVFKISPQSAGMPADELVAGLPVEDMEQCIAAKPEINACIAAAADIAAVKQCIADGTKKKDGE